MEYISGRWTVDIGEFVVKAKPSFPSEWHLSASRKQVPLERGSDSQFGFIGGFSLYTPERNWPHVINYEHQSFSSQYQWNMGRRYEAAIVENGKDDLDEQREQHLLPYGFPSAPAQRVVFVLAGERRLRIRRV